MEAGAKTFLPCLRINCSTTFYKQSSPAFSTAMYRSTNMSVHLPSAPSIRPCDCCSIHICTSTCERSPRSNIFPKRRQPAGLNYRIILLLVSFDLQLCMCSSFLHATSMQPHMLSHCRASAPFSDFVRNTLSSLLTVAQMLISVNQRTHLSRLTQQERSLVHKSKQRQ